MSALPTPRLWLLPLTREVVQRRVQGADFSLNLTTPGGLQRVHFPAEWPGDPLPLFPMQLEQWPPGEAAWPGSFILVRRGDAQAIGLLGTKGGPTEAGDQEIGYGLNPDAWGLGYATEAVAALVSWLLAQPGVRVVTAETALSNAASARVLEKLGFLQVGRRTDEEDGELQLWAKQA